MTVQEMKKVKEAFTENDLKTLVDAQAILNKAESICEPSHWITPSLLIDVLSD
jgi:hypothetical protein